MIRPNFKVTYAGLKDSKKNSSEIWINLNLSALIDGMIDFGFIDRHFITAIIERTHTLIYGRNGALSSFS